MNNVKMWIDISGLLLQFSEGAEYECPTDEQFQQKNGRLCMSLSLACDGLPNCGENIIPNADEACFKVDKLSK